MFIHLNSLLLLLFMSLVRVNSNSYLEQIFDNMQNQSIDSFVSE